MGSCLDTMASCCSDCCRDTTQTGTGIPATETGIGVPTTGIPATETKTEVETGTGIPATETGIGVETGTGIPATETRTEVETGTGIPATETGIGVETGTGIPATETGIGVKIGTGIPTTETGTGVEIRTWTGIPGTGAGAEEEAGVGTRTWTIRVGKELPRFIVLKSNYNSKYLRYIKEDIKEHGFLQFSGEEAVSPYAKYEVEMAKCGKGLVNIRCCYNNKYWTRSSEHHLWLVAGANESEEDKSKWSCTLFEPVYVDDSMVRFRHVQLGNYACLWSPRGDARDSYLVLGSKSIDKDQCDVCTFIDWESLLILPRHVAFKGDNGKYLSARQIDECPYLQFASRDIGDPTVGNEVFTTPDGSVRIKSVHSNSYWKRNNLSWICPDSEDTSNKNLDTLFWPVKVDNNAVALQNLGNKNFCMRLTAEEKRSCLSASVCTISKEARLGVDELVLSRNIYNVNYRLMDARMYGQSVLTMATANATNTTQVPNDVEMKLSYTEHKSQTWNASVSLNLGIKTNIQASVPLIATGGIELSVEFTGEYEWGKTKDSTNMMETTYRVTVPPMSKVTVSLLATKGSCDVPFSYSQRDTLINGKQFTQRMEDGVYTGTNCFYFEYHTKQEKL